MKNNKLLIIAGPCAVESKEQIIRIAMKLKDLGIEYLRAGAFKPRTNPNSFQGLGEKGILYLIEAKKLTGLKIVSEIMDIEQLNKYGKYLDIIQIGARNMYNYELLKALGKINKPILLKRAFSATYQEWIGAYEYIKQSGNNQVILCERGIRSFDNSTRNVLDIQAIPYIKENYHLPIIVDPSHASGHRYLVESDSLAAIAAGADGLIIEVHDYPEESLSDKEQAINIDELQIIINKINKVKEVI